MDLSLQLKACKTSLGYNKDENILLVTINNNMKARVIELFGGDAATYVNE